MWARAAYIRPRPAPSPLRPPPKPVSYTHLTGQRIDRASGAHPLFRGQAAHVQGLLDVQFPGFAVGAQAAIVVDPVGAVGILLDLTDQDPGADGMDGPRLDEKHVPRSEEHTSELQSQR